MSQWLRTQIRKTMPVRLLNPGWMKTPNLAVCRENLALVSPLRA